MKKPIIYIILLCISFAFYPACKKSKSVTVTPFADSLRKYCTAPFVGQCDSGNIYFATAFTPNGDGIDDIYGIIGNFGSFSNFSLKIYDTTGTLVFQTTQAAFRMWDGIDMNTGKQSTKYKFYVKINYTTTGNITDSGSTFLFLLANNASGQCVHEVPADSSLYEFTDQFLPAIGFVPHSTSFETYCN